MDDRLEAQRERVCFQLQVRPDRIQNYREAHAAVWPEMLEALEATGWHNYSLFLRPDGLLIGYFETDDLQASLDGMAATDVNAKWQASMVENFVDLDVPADEGFLRLAEIFNLHDQLSKDAP
ncbi:L-rhamnose mutarotase [Salinibacterium sp.]|uniref:L-rhamnose mutarotase n=1 Tax=Salinibacterium sp. TaxID=1915057 RepID=UPI00286D4FC8|nr:L-rhamnose mutarotase [Salinibacterium sp.]